VRVYFISRLGRPAEGYYYRKDNIIRMHEPSTVAGAERPVIRRGRDVTGSGRVYYGRRSSSTGRLHYAISPARDSKETDMDKLIPTIPLPTCSPIDSI